MQVKLLIQTCHKRGVHAMGGMAAQIPIKDDKAANDRAMEGVRAEGRVLRYLARIESPPDRGGRPVLRVGPLAVPQEHPAARLKGAEAFVAFTTERHAQWPLLVQGAGAGGAVTASGVLADLLEVARAAPREAVH